MRILISAWANIFPMQEYGIKYRIKKGWIENVRN